MVATLTTPPAHSVQVVSVSTSVPEYTAEARRWCRGGLPRRALHFQPGRLSSAAIHSAVIERSLYVISFGWRGFYEHNAGAHKVFVLSLYVPLAYLGVAANLIELYGVLHGLELSTIMVARRTQV